MRRAALCLLSTLVLAAAPPVIAQEVAPSDPAVGAALEQAPSSSIRTSSIPDAKPADTPVSVPEPALSEPPATPAAEDAASPAETAAPEAPTATTPAVPSPDAPATATPAETETPASPAAPELAAPAAPPPPLNAALLAAIESSQPAAGEERAWHEAIGAFYTARQGLPLWTTDSGLNSAALALVAEIARADDWGLDAKAFDVAGLPEGSADLEVLAAAELKLTRALVTYAWHARGGRVDPVQLSKWLEQSPRPLDVQALLTQFAATGDPSRALQQLHPQHRQFELLRQAYLKARDAKDEVQADPRETTIPNGPVIRLGDRHAHVALVRQRLDVPAQNSDDEELYDEEVAAAVRQHLGASYRTRSGKRVQRARHPALTNGARTSLNRAVAQQRDRAPTLEQYVVNLERWRWMPEHLGETYVWNNLPEYQVRVIRNQSVIFQERIIIGKPANQTPVFSDEMQFVVFHPDWGVPGTIKVQDLLPALQAGDDSILTRRNMRIVNGNRTVRAHQIDWDRTDIRRVSIIQDPGPSNPLGQLKFMFPNKHDVYMHDTPTKHLFDTRTRAYSFGCIRVRNPLRFAEVLFSQDRRWGMSDITERVKRNAPKVNRVDLNRRIPVHNTYFTLLADENGKVSRFADVYGHDRRIQAVLLDGERVDVIARSDPAAALERRVKELAANPRPRRSRERYTENSGGWGGWGWGPPPQRRGRSAPSNDFFSGLFGN